jgi:hypothetical protein
MWHRPSVDDSRTPNKKRGRRDRKNNHICIWLDPSASDEVLNCRNDYSDDLFFNLGECVVIVSADFVSRAGSTGVASQRVFPGTPLFRLRIVVALFHAQLPLPDPDFCNLLN